MPANLNIKIGAQTKNFKIEKEANNDFFPSPDRVTRGEVYEKEWAKMSVGKFDLQKGKQELSLQLMEKQTNGWLQIKAIDLIEEIPK